MSRSDELWWNKIRNSSKQKFFWSLSPMNQFSFWSEQTFHSAVQLEYRERSDKYGCMIAKEKSLIIFMFRKVQLEVFSRKRKKISRNSIVFNQPPTPFACHFFESIFRWACNRGGCVLLIYRFLKQKIRQKKIADEGDVHKYQSRDYKSPDCTCWFCISVSEKKNLNMINNILIFQ